MSLVVFVIVTSAFTALALGSRARPQLSNGIGIVGLVLAVILAITLVPGQIVVIGGGAIATTAYVRLFLVLGSVLGLALAISGQAGGSRRDAPTVTLGILAAAALTIGVLDPRAAVLVATAGGLFGVLVTLVPNGGRVGATVGVRESRAVAVAGALAIAATAWFGRDLSGLDAQPVVFGLAYLAFAVAVALRFGEIPFHLWAARLADVVPETALPILTAYAPASLALVAVAWIDASVTPFATNLDLDRLVIIAIAVASIVLAAVAAFVQDDIEHILGYSIVGDAGVIVLALTALGPEAWGPTRMWILAFVIARSAFAGWIAGIRAGFWTGRVADLRGWVRRSPLLTVTFALVAIASVGFPGLVAFDARAAIVNDTLAGPLATIVLIAVLAPIAYYGRLLVIGLLPPDRLVEPVDAWRPVVTRLDLTAVRPWLAATWDANRAFTTSAIAFVLAILALATAGGAFGGPAAAAEPAPVLADPHRIELPATSGARPSVGPAPAASEPPSASP
ncbi:MAG TPA: proton-conducting transporter membrane subunit [Candidatus Limnocylindrales bacterium]|nr:proton-conducting transporter membrane subunit [Candidatus Limnocylindrales bacterium]